MDRDELLDIKQAAKILNVTETSLRRWTNSGQLACVRVGTKRERRFRRADLLAFLEEQPVRRSIGAGAEGGTDPIVFTVVGGVPLASGTHLCSLYTSDTGRTKLAVGFLADGLTQGSACYLVASRASTQQVLAQLEQHVPSIQSDIDTGRLVLSEFADTGPLQLEQLESGFITSIRNGAQSIRLVGNVSESPFAQSQSIDYIVKFEQDFDRLLSARFPLVALCQYDARAYSGIELCNVLNCHHDAFRYPAERLLF